MQGGEGGRGMGPWRCVWLSAKRDATRAVTVAQSILASELEGGDKDDAGQEVSREQQCFLYGTVLPAGRG